MTKASAEAIGVRGGAGLARVNKSHAGRLVGTAEIPHLLDGIAAAPNASPLCQLRTYASQQILFHCVEPCQDYSAIELELIERSCAAGAHVVDLPLESKP